MTPERLVIGRFNREAVEALRAYVRAHPDLPYDVLLVSAAAGMGKTHLLHAVREECDRERPGLEVALASAEEYVQAWERGDREGHAIRWRNADMVFLDDAHLLYEAVDPAAALTRLAAGTPEVGWVLAADAGAEPRGPLGEWLSGATPVRIGPASPGTLERIVREEAEVYGLPVDDERILDWIQIAEGNVRHALDLLNAESGAEVPPEMEEAKEGEFETFLSDITATVSDIVEPTPWRARVGEAVLRWGGHGFSTRSLEALLRQEDADAAVRRLEAFEDRARRLVELRTDVEARFPEAMPDPVFSDPERLDEAVERLERLERPEPRPADAPATASRADAEPPEPGGDAPSEATAAGSTSAAGDAQEVDGRSPPSAARTGPDLRVRESERVCRDYLSLDDRLMEEVG